MKIKSVNRIKLIVFSAVLLLSLRLSATTWDEPWHDEVVKKAESFILAKILSADEEKGIKIRVLKQLGGVVLPETIEVTDFYLLSLCSSSGDHGPEFRFDGLDSCYFFIKKNEAGKYCIATPTTGFAYITEGKVYATYRHSYHQALVEAGMYEKTMSCVFNQYHGLSWDKAYVDSLVSSSLSQKPAGFEEDELPLFFLQHVSMELVCHLKLSGYLGKLLPFLADNKNFHNQVSAARALSVYNDEAAQSALVKQLEDDKTGNFTKTMIVWALKETKPVKHKAVLKKIMATASDESNGFGGNIMDPRVCTRIPSLKDALEELLRKL